MLECVSQATRRANEMATKRRRFTAEFKANVVMEALRGDRTIQAIAAKNEMRPNQICRT